jgi:hypothetical protein
MTRFAACFDKTGMPYQLSSASQGISNLHPEIVSNVDRRCHE